MANLGPREVLEHFAEDLSQGRDEVAKTELVKGEASYAALQASDFLAGAESAANVANSELHSLRMTAISAIESAGEDIDGRDVLEATMAARGQSGQEIEDYFSHVERIEAEEQPVIVICQEEQEIGFHGLTKVIYGMILGQSANAFTNRDRKIQFGKNGKLPSLRDVVIPISSKRGYSLAPREHSIYGADISVFANNADEETAEPITVNEQHGFERVNFAGSAEEVRDTAHLIVAKDMRTIADHGAVRTLGLPTMVAYGEDAVLELSARIRAARDDRLSALNRRSLEGLVDLEDIMPELADLQLPAAQKESYHGEFQKALIEFLERGEGLVDDDNSAASRLAFWSPLQEAIDFDLELVLEEVQTATFAVYSEDIGHVVTENHSSASAVQDELLAKIRRLEKFGVKAAQNRPALRHAAGRIEVQAIDLALLDTPRRKPLARHLLKKALGKAETKANI